ncbi:MAG: phosphoribosylanthranilate isomerase [Lachnospiraceae bacterium]|nr:phosphoribosylanthranilate isomerase [Lachnospiraceae bacterium]
MTKIKLCGLKRMCDVEWANELLPDYIGFVFAAKSKRYVTPEQASELKACLHPKVKAVGVFVNEAPERIAELCKNGIIDVVQLHGNEDEAYIGQLRMLTGAPVIQAFQVAAERDVVRAGASSAEFVLLDSGGGTGTVFDWELLKSMKRPYFLAGGLTPQNVGEALMLLRPYGVDASSSLETDGVKDKEKMTDFVRAVRNRKEG